MARKEQDARVRARRKKTSNLRDSVEEMMAIMADTDGYPPKVKPPPRKRRESYKKIMSLLSKEERAEAQAFVEDYVEYLQARHEHAASRRKLR